MKTISVFASLAFSALLTGLTVEMLWDWFIVPVFGLPTLSLSHAIGLALLVSYMTVQKPVHEKNFKFYDNLAEGLIYKILITVLTLGIGWILS